MIGSTRQLTVYAYAAPCDMRKQYDSLAAVVVGCRLDLSPGVPMRVNPVKTA